MRRRHLAWLAGGALLLAVALVAATLLLMALTLASGLPTSGELVGELLYTLTFLTMSVVGALIAWRRPDTPIGWLFCASGLIEVIAGTAETYAMYTLQAAPGALPAGELMAWLSEWLNSFGLAAVALLLFPTGRLPSRRWRPVAWLIAGWYAATLIGPAFTPGPLRYFPSVSNPAGLTGVAGEAMLRLTHALDPLFGLVLLAPMLSLILRFRRAGGIERQQLKWFVSAAIMVALFALSIALTELIVRDAAMEQWWVVLEPLMNLSIMALPVSVGIAILRYRLYDIDLIINRALVYGGLTGSLTIIYLGGVLLLQGLFRTLTGQENNLAIVVSTLAAAALFQPLRGRLQAVIDRRFYRRKYDAARTLAAFSARLRDEVELSTLSDDLLAVVAETMQPAHVSLWLRQPPVNSEQWSVNSGQWPRVRNSRLGWLPRPLPSVSWASPPPAAGGHRLVPLLMGGLPGQRIHG